MIDLRQDPVVNVVQEGIKGDLRAVLETGRFRAAVTLTFAGIDQLAYLGMPPAKVEVEPEDFIEWADRYIAIDDAPIQPAGVDYYGARCGMLHTYGSASRRSRRGDARHIFYKYRRPGPAVDFLRPSDPDLKSGCFVVSVEALTEAFVRGADRFLVDVFRDETRAAIAEKRFRGMYHLIPAPKP